MKYLDDLLIESVFENEGVLKKRTFKMGKQTDIIVNESIEYCPDGDIGQPHLSGPA